MLCTVRGVLHFILLPEFLVESLFPSRVHNWCALANTTLPTSGEDCWEMLYKKFCCLFLDCSLIFTNLPLVHYMEHWLLSDLWMRERASDFNVVCVYVPVVNMFLWSLLVSCLSSPPRFNDRPQLLDSPSVYFLFALFIFYWPTFFLQTVAAAHVWYYHYHTVCVCVCVCDGITGN